MARVAGSSWIDEMVVGTGSQGSYWWRQAEGQSSLVLVACMSTIRRLPLLNATSLMHFDDVVGTAIV